MFESDIHVIKSPSQSTVLHFFCLHLSPAHIFHLHLPFPCSFLFPLPLPLPLSLSPTPPSSILFSSPFSQLPMSKSSRATSQFKKTNMQPSPVTCHAPTVPTGTWGITTTLLHSHTMTAFPASPIPEITNYVLQSNQHRLFLTTSAFLPQPTWTVLQCSALCLGLVVNQMILHAVTPSTVALQRSEVS